MLRLHEGAESDARSEAEPANDDEEGIGDRLWGKTKDCVKSAGKDELNAATENYINNDDLSVDNPEEHLGDCSEPGQVGIGKKLDSFVFCGLLFIV